MKNGLIFILIFTSLNLFAGDKPSFNTWLENIKLEMVNDHGFPKTLVKKAFTGVKFNQQVINYDRRQPEFVTSAGRYIGAIISRDRIAKGRKYLNQLSSLFVNIYDDYSVQDRFLLSFWALETNFSSYTGNMDIIECLATLTYDGRREKFFKAELINALKVLQIENFQYPTNRMQGSWAGAMGSTQFLPKNILKYSLDYDQDGFINMWSNKSDFLASSGNFLNQEGWNGNESWGQVVKLPKGFDYFHSGLDNKRSVSYWSSLGVKLSNGDVLPASDNHVALYLPQGYKGPIFLVYNNFFTIFKWNYSAKYALGIGILSDLLTKRGSYFSSFDLKEENFLTFKLTKKIQKRLNDLGFEAGKVDGIPGSKTYRAIQRFQQSISTIADGHLTRRLVKQLSL